MFTYYVDLGLRSLSRNILITSLMILLISVGVAGSITTYALLNALSANRNSRSMMWPHFVAIMRPRPRLPSTR